MKKLLLLSVCIFALQLNSFSQEQAQEKADSGNSYLYCEIVGMERFMSSKVTVSVDFGQATRLFSDQRLRDENGNTITFNSMIDAMNWMGSDGWEFIQAYVITEGQQNVYHWMLKLDTKKIPEAQRADILSKFRTRKDFK